MSQLLTFAPDAVIRFRLGRIVVHSTASAMPAFESDNPMLIGWLCQFVRPMSVETAIAKLSPDDRQQVGKVLDYLKKSGVLSEAQTPDAKREPAREHKQSLRLLGRSVYQLACDINALSPAADEELQARSGLGIQSRLMSLLAAIDGLRGELAALAHRQIKEQLGRLSVGVDNRDLKLHIGCGRGLLDGWINIDVHPAPLALNVLRGLPFQSASVTRVFVSHLMEHLFNPVDVKPFLNELRRVLAPQGIVRIVVPDIEQCIQAYVNDDREFFASRRETWSWWPENPTRLEDFLAYAGAGPEPAYAFESHKYGYDFETLSSVLAEAGFSGIVRSDYMSSEHPELRVDDISDVAKARYGERYYSLFVEARVP